MTIIFRRLMRAAVLLITTVASFLPTTAYAAEGGSGHYLPGGTSSFIDTLPGRPGLA